MRHNRGEMGYIDARRQRLARRLAAVQAQIKQLETVMLKMAATGASSYEFDSGEGKQRTTRRSLDEIKKTLDGLYAAEDHYINELSCMGIVSLRLRRRP